MADSQVELKKKLDDRMHGLPAPVRNAIQSADIEKHLRVLAESHKLHIDKWQLLENEVMLAVLGFNPVSNLVARLKSEVRMVEGDAIVLAADISKIVFEPIRAELERQLEHPEAQDEKTTAVENVRSELLSKQTETPPEPASAAAPKAPAADVKIVPATPPQPAPDGKAERAPISTSYLSSTPSHERPAIEGDPYREQVG